MAEVNTSATTTPKTTMRTELWYSTSSSYTSMKQVFMVQSIPAIQPPKDAINYGCLESSTEFQTEGTRKAETISVPILYVEAQHNELKTLADVGTELYFVVKLPESTTATAGHPLACKFSGTIDISLDEQSIDSMIQETLTIYKDSPVTETTWNTLSA
mgnify:CR=1 FL=1